MARSVAIAASERALANRPLQHCYGSRSGMGHREAWRLNWLDILGGAKLRSIGKSRVSIGLRWTEIGRGHLGTRRRIRVRRGLCVSVGHRGRCGQPGAGMWNWRDWRSAGSSVWNLHWSDPRRARGWNRRHGKSLRPYRRADQQQRQDQRVQSVCHICQDRSHNDATTRT
jgi:hypothetical protein